MRTVKVSLCLHLWPTTKPLNLDTVVLTFNDLRNVNVQGVTGPECGDVVTEGLLVEEVISA